MVRGKRAFAQLLLRLSSAVLISTLLAACAASTLGEQSPAPGRQVGNQSCSLRATVHIRQGTSIRSDADLAELGRRLGVNLTVLQSLSISTKLVNIRESGPDSLCEMSFEALRNDLQIESVQRY